MQLHAFEWELHGWNEKKIRIKLTVLGNLKFVSLWNKNPDERERERDEVIKYIQFRNFTF